MALNSHLGIDKRAFCSPYWVFFSRCQEKIYFKSAFCFGDFRDFCSWGSSFSILFGSCTCTCYAGRIYWYLLSYLSVCSLHIVSSTGKNRVLTVQGKYCCQMRIIKSFGKIPFLFPIILKLPRFILKKKIFSNIPFDCTCFYSSLTGWKKCNIQSFRDNKM